MRIIVLAASKGGTGKTTLAAALSALAAQTEKAGVADLDPQQSLARWLELRGHFHADLKSPALYVAETIEGITAQAEKDGVDSIFIDTPPAMISHILPAVTQAHLVLIPVKPSLLDLEAIDPITEMCRDYQKRFAFILTMVPHEAATLAASRKYLAHDGKVLKDALFNRQIFATAMIKGGTAGEADKTGKSASEIHGLLLAIRHELRSATRALQGKRLARPPVKTRDHA